MSKYQVITGVKVPALRSINDTNPELKAAIGSMQINSVVNIPAEDYKAWKSILSNIRSKKDGRQFSERKQEDGSYDIYRIEDKTAAEVATDAAEDADPAAE